MLTVTMEWEMALFGGWVGVTQEIYLVELFFKSSYCLLSSIFLPHSLPLSNLKELKILRIKH
jgi:hypothetical protein